MGYVAITDDSVYHNKRRTAKLGLLSILDKNEINRLVDKYFRDSNGNLHCAYTGEILNQDNLELEHIIPVSLGGGTVIFNCVPASSKVNGTSEKHTNYLFDWWTNSKYYSEESLERLVNYIFEAYEVFISGGFKNKAHKETEEEIMLLEEKNTESNNNVNVSGNESIPYKNPYIYYIFLKDCVDRLGKQEYFKKFEDLKNTNIFNIIEAYDEILATFVGYLNKKSNLDLTTIAINCNIPYILKRLNCNKDTLIPIIDKKIDDLYRAINDKVDFPVGMDSLLSNINIIPDILTYNNLDNELIERVLKNICYCKNDKLSIIIEYYSKNRMWPSSSTSLKGCNFALYSFVSKIRSGEIPVSKEEKEDILLLDPKFFMDQNYRAIHNIVYKIVHFYEDNQRRPRHIVNPQSEKDIYENLLAKSINRVSNSPNLTPELRNKLLSVDPNFFDNQDELQKYETLSEIIDFYDSHNPHRWPKRIENADTHEKIHENRLAARLARYRDMKDLLDEKFVCEIEKRDPGFFKNQNERQTHDTVMQLIDFYDSHNPHRWPRAIINPKTEEEKYEYFLRKRLQNIKNGSINVDPVDMEELLKRDLYEREIYPDGSRIKRENCEGVLYFYDSHEPHRWPRIINNPKDEIEVEENKLGLIFRDLRTAKTLTDDYKQEFLRRDPYAFMDRNDRQTMEVIKNLISFYDSHNPHRWPQKKQKPETEEEIQEDLLAQRTSNIRSLRSLQMLNTNSNLIFELLRRDPNFFENQNEVSASNKLAESIKMYINNGHWPKESENGTLNSFIYNIKSGRIPLSDMQIKEIIKIDPSFDLSKVKRRNPYLYIVEHNGKKDDIKKIELGESKKAAMK